MHFDRLKRREFLTLIGGTAAWPLQAQAQQAALPVIGFLDVRSADAMSSRLRAFRLGLKDTGYVEGENVAFSYHFAENQTDRLPELAADLVRRQVAVIAATAGNAAFAAKARHETEFNRVFCNQEPRPTRWQPDGHQSVHRRVGGKAAGTPARAGAPSCSRCCDGTLG
jgi:hypothetical protein